MFSRHRGYSAELPTRYEFDSNHRDRGISGAREGWISENPKTTFLPVSDRAPERSRRLILRRRSARFDAEIAAWRCHKGTGFLLRLPSRFLPRRASRKPAVPCIYPRLLRRASVHGLGKRLGRISVLDSERQLPPSLVRDVSGPILSKQFDGSRSTWRQRVLEVKYQAPRTRKEKEETDIYRRRRACAPVFPDHPAGRFVTRSCGSKREKSIHDISGDAMKNDPPFLDTV